MPVTIDMRRARRGHYGYAPQTPMGDLPGDRGEALGDLGQTVDIGKPQAVRLADIAVFGPMMIYSGMGKKMPKWLRWGIVIVGVGTIIYNFHYYMVNRQAAQAGATALEGLQVGPWGRVADMRRPGQLRRG